MNETFKLVTREHGTEIGCDLSFLSEAEARKIRDFHKSFPMYAPTPLAHLPDTAKCLGLGDVYVKDASNEDMGHFIRCCFTRIEFL